jgi:DNA-binding transcriptional ArsR family regulator
VREFVSVTKALADENRLRMLLALKDRELCACQITELFGLASSTVSKHMWVLSQARLVDRRKQGRWMYYRQAGRDAPAPVRAAIRWVHQSLVEDPRILRDARRLEAILRVDPEVLCRRQCRR